jgi:hypothetical protein
MECFICSREQGAGGELPVCIRGDGKKAHQQCFVKQQAFNLFNEGRYAMLSTWLPPARSQL